MFGCRLCECFVCSYAWCPISCFIAEHRVTRSLTVAYWTRVIWKPGTNIPMFWSARSSGISAGLCDACEFVLRVRCASTRMIDLRGRRCTITDLKGSTSGSTFACAACVKCPRRFYPVRSVRDTFDISFCRWTWTWKNAERPSNFLSSSHTARYGNWNSTISPRCSF